MSEPIVQFRKKSEFDSNRNLRNVERNHAMEIEKKLKRISMVETPNHYSSDLQSASLRRFLSIQSLKQSINTSTTLAPATSSVSVGNISNSLRSNNSSNTAKHEQTTVAATVAAATTTPPEKEKKRKEVSSSRVKKFHRHFTQVPKDEKLINYFSCALVSDILLQGHLYITEQHFAFYSNVFGYVTKVVIPTSSVTKISKEKTAKIIPNAVGVATADERHVFASFISRESAFRLMCSVCPPMAPAEVITKTPADIEISEEYSIEDDSSCSVSGNESPPRGLADNEAASNAAEEDASQKLLRRTAGSSSFTAGDSSHTTKGKGRGSDIPQINGLGHGNIGVRASAPPTAPIHTSSASTSTTGVAASAATNLTMIIAGTASSTASTSTSSTPTPSTSSSPTTVMAKPKTTVQFATENFKLLSKKLLINIKMPTEQQLVYLGVFLALILSLFSIFLLYRILNIEAKTSLYNSPTSFKWRTGNDDDIFTEALRWQQELQHKSSEEAQLILKNNLEQISKVRRSLETLSALIHDRSSAYTNTISNDSD
ncbi:serine-rich adhesin for platelets-like isoform X2 [Teleopsis dalmanni]|uniref:serine-rich adhesin for platelets-like isoform X2 n=1 Tax=Teleopsis dalmanni TaxID=139649 RepID=UPI0018CDB339|nr:serine-rich adhesin for platelets-like isoform X2 [Teleopsis dalmanni]